MTGDLPYPLPIVGGHEGAGVVVEVGSEVTRAKVGDHVLMSPMMACGACRWCNEGKSYLCDVNAHVEKGLSPDGSFRFFLNGEGVRANGQLGAFSEYLTLSELQVVVIDDGIPMTSACLLGCGVTTGFGAAVNAARVRAGDVAVVVGVGGIGMSAVQGARIAGASIVVAVDPVEFKRESAFRFGATHVAGSAQEAVGLVSELTRNVMADKVIVTVSLLDGREFETYNALTAKGGTICATSVAPYTERTINLPLNEFFFSNKTIVGNVAGLAAPLADWPKLIKLYQSGSLLLDEMVTREYKLDDVNQGYADMHAGRNIRGIIRF